MEVKEYFDFLGINKFWEAGYKGRNVRIMSGERIIKDYYNTEKWRNIISPEESYDNTASHGSSCMDIIMRVCPDSTFYAYPLNYGSGGCKCADYIKEHKIHLFTTSRIAATPIKKKEEAIQECIDEGCTFFMAAGNDGENGVRGEAKSDKYLAIGIADFVNGKLQRVSPSSIGEELDYVMLPPFGRWASYCAPLFCGMCGLVQDFFISKTGSSLKREKLVKFIDDHLIDLEEPGFDNKTGKGLFILPDPKDIKIEKYSSNYVYVKDYKSEQLSLFDTVDKPSEWAVEAWNWGKENNICDGTRPKDNITREEVVQMLYNFKKMQGGVVK